MDFGKGNNNGNTGLLIPILIGVAVALVIGGFLLAQWSLSSFPLQGSQESKQVDNLFNIMLVIGGAIFLLVEGLLLFSVIRFRRREGEEGDGATIHGNVTLEVVWTAIPSVIVLMLVIYSYNVWVDIRAPKDDEVTVRAIARQFAWTFHYDDERINETISSPILHTYSNTTVKMVMQAEDVIHSFWLPEMRVKQDVIPGRITEVRFTPIFIEDEAVECVDGIMCNEYRVVCAELCGSGHGNMYATIRVYQNEADYLTAFADAAVDLVINPPDDPVLRGAQLLASGAYPCSGCHILNDEQDGVILSWAGQTGPVLDGLGERADERISGTLAEEYIYQSIYQPAYYLVPGFGALMNQFQSTDPTAPNYMAREDAIAIVSYLCTLTDSGDSACDLDNLNTYDESFWN